MNNLSTLFGVLTLSLLLGCGGGGSAGGDSSGNGNTPPAQNGGGGGELNPGLTGSFIMRPADTPTYWRIDAATGVSTALLNLPGYLKQSVSFSPDRSRYAVTSWDTRTGYENSDFMTLEVFDTASSTRLLAMTFDGYAHSFQFSKDNRFLSALRYPDIFANSTLVESGVAILDLADPANPRTVVNFMGTGRNVVYDFSWLPDNRYVYLRGDRTLIAGNAMVLGGNESVKANLAVPAGLFVSRGFVVSPDGRQILYNFNWMDGPLSQSDWWIANLDGSGLERLSTGNYGDSAQWSPDGRYIMLRTNAGAAWVGGASTAYCERWYVPSTARNVWEGSPEAREVRYVDPRYGRVERLPCFYPVTYGG